ncbi:MAG: type II toxin-antitoxin system VapC family toxin [Bryobacteraceae bacterium]
MLALDTNTVIYFFKGVGRVAENLQREAPREIGIPAVVLYELEVGIARSRRPRQRRESLAALLQVIHILPFDERAARASAELRAELERAGKGIGPMDTLIAGTALAYSAALVTHNAKEFSRVRGLRLLDWY